MDGNQKVGSKITRVIKSKKELWNLIPRLDGQKARRPSLPEAFLQNQELDQYAIFLCLYELQQKQPRMVCIQRYQKRITFGVSKQSISKEDQDCLNYRPIFGAHDKA